MVTFVAETLCFNLATFYYEIFFLIFIIRGLRFASYIVMFPFQDHSKNYCGLSRNFQDGKKKKISLNYFITQLKLLPSCMFHWVESVYMLSTNLSREKLLTYNGKRKIHAHQILASK